MIISRFGFLEKKSGLSAEEFDKHWKNVHGPLASRLPRLTGYIQNTVVDKSHFETILPSGELNLDGIAELQFRSIEDMNAAIFDSQEAQDVYRDVDFVDDVKVVVCEKHIVTPIELGDGPYIKRISLLKRLPGVSPEEFRHEWLGLHAELVSQWDNVLGYVQNLVVDRFHNPGTESVGHDEVPVDGIVEFWFRNKEEASQTYASEACARTRDHGADFVEQITPFFVEDRKLV
ncbi:EthD domain-containing protein [Sinisalibacter aestuarii]|uniref:EthD domain-containing protein n=1 Tax=Sinisalibacter aestuarii TaxID=2949426 RepID=A0ABQ5LNK1_9RHOB|nr:EthD domain-containing protein [Sinisalibacter aestuarii]GKY86584.1 hypothetical protein STA1M1_04530 [Sinisalibacter aestuarii]